MKFHPLHEALDFALFRKIREMWFSCIVAEFHEIYDSCLKSWKFHKNHTFSPDAENVALAQGFYWLFGWNFMKFQLFAENPTFS